MTSKDVPGAISALEKLSGDLNLYINSATPQLAIEKIIEKLGWRKYFRGIYGHPPSAKLNNLKKIIELENVVPRNVVVVGDGPSDLEVAKACGTCFIGIKGEFNKWPKMINFPILTNLIKLPETIDVFNY